MSNDWQQLPMSWRVGLIVTLVVIVLTMVFIGVDISRQPQELCNKPNIRPCLQTEIPLILTGAPRDE